MNTIIKSTLTIFLFSLFICSQPLQAQTSCTSCSITNCSAISVGFSYNGLSYNYSNIPWVSGMNVRVAMLNAQALNAFQFTTTSYCPYGGYLVSFNGVYSGSNNFWQLEINGVAANFGMDFQQVNANDQIRWVLTDFNAKSKKSISHQHIMASMHTKNIINK